MTVISVLSGDKTAPTITAMVYSRDFQFTFACNHSSLGFRETEDASFKPRGSQN